MSDIPHQDSEVSPQQRQGLALALVGEGAAPCCEGEGGGVNPRHCHHQHQLPLGLQTGRNSTGLVAVGV